MAEGKVPNWQLGREMDYPYPETRPETQWGAVFDTNKCIACQTCTNACKTTWTTGKGMEYMFWNNVETKPYGFYPLAWDVRLLELLGPQRWEGGVYAGKTIFEAPPTGEVAQGFLPEDDDWARPNLGEDETSGALDRAEHLTIPHRIWHFYLPRTCNHCTYPACLASCPRKAIYKRREDGIVLIDQTRCRGYRECGRGCPYKKPFFNEVTKISEKCVGCYPLWEKGEVSQCMRTCIGRIRMNGSVRPPVSADPESPIDYLVHVKGLALPLYPQFGTEPNIYYVPPIHVPEPYLRQLFGPGVTRAVEAYRAAREDETLLGVLALFGSTDRQIAKFKVARGSATGYGVDGKELVTVPVREPQFVRPFFDEPRGTYRLNMT